ncbi:hypothetical protein FBBAL38_00120 [Flavobacteria bacterium BAL38]|nr:hypothetical protein FBBAL38_00120 [Flavobacteria bacterium BAL38]
MKKHRGELLRKGIYESGYPITKLAKRMGKSRKWIYLLFEKSNVSIDIMNEIGNIIQYDFFEDKILENNTKSYNEEFWKNKYLKLIEEFNAFLKNKNNSV